MLDQISRTSGPTSISNDNISARSPEFQAQQIIAQSTNSTSRDITMINDKLLILANSDPASARNVRQAVEAQLTPVEAGNLRAQLDRQTGGNSRVTEPVILAQSTPVESGNPSVQLVQQSVTPSSTTDPVILTRPDGKRTDGFGVLMTGNEPAYDPSRWNTGSGTETQDFNNCYAYALNDLLPNRSSKPQPGERSGGSMSDYLTGSGIDIGRLQSSIATDARVQGGNISFLGNTPESTINAPEGSYIVALVVDNRDGVQDYHWYRHNPDGSWSGKSGGGPATNLDASGNIVLDPRTANRDYGPVYGRNQSGNVVYAGDLNYTQFVGYYAVQSGAQVGNTPRN
jgi:hypothetical protein